MQALDIETDAWRHRAQHLPPALADIGANLGWIRPLSFSSPELEKRWRNARGNWIGCIRRALEHISVTRLQVAGEWLELARKIEADWHEGRYDVTRDIEREVTRRTRIIL
jgi:hypothetical protein